MGCIESAPVETPKPTQINKGGESNLRVLHIVHFNDVYNIGAIDLYLYHE